MSNIDKLKITLQEILVATNHFAEENYIGLGGFGKVYKGKSEKLGEMAIKRLDRDHGQGDHQFKMEIDLLSVYQHENIVSLLGFCDENDEKILVYKYESKGSLDKHLNSKDLTWIQRLQICIDAARGLKYLHDDVGPQHRILHRDVKSANILLDENWNAKISDFGLSRIGPAHQQSTFLISNPCGTPGYIDPEYMNTGCLTQKSDVYSFGVVLFEVLCGRPACVTAYKDERQFLTVLAPKHYKKKTLDKIILSDLEKQIISTSLSIFSTIAYECLKNEKERPTMKKVMERLQKALDCQLASSPSKDLDNMTYPSRPWKYDVFVSFGREDICRTFVDHLYSALEKQAIRIYKDDATLDRRESTGPSLLNAIQESQIAVIVFSESYADSSWCLEELAYIMKCRKQRGLIVMPIFYHIDPSDQKGKYEEAFAKHELSEKNNNKVELWRKALVDASNIAGWEPKHVVDGHEAKCINKLVVSVLDRLFYFNSFGDENLVGMGTRLQDLKSQLRIGYGGVRMVGIWGVGGGGKTTLATSLFLEISAMFDSCCFVKDIREEYRKHGLETLQEKILSTILKTQEVVQSVAQGKHMIKRMLCRRNVLIVLDNVDDHKQLEALAGSCDWFGDGSRIIITTRDEHLLTTHRVDVVSPISLLSRDEAIRLFNKHAYNEDNPLQDYEMLSQQIVAYAGGLPLALIVLGSFLYGKDKDEWLRTLARLKEHPDMDILEKLKISYDGLHHVEKELFLDIACFHIGTREEAMKMLDAFGFYPHVGIKVLIQKALITVTKDGRFDMHDLVQEMGHYIVRGEHPNNPETHSRLWRYQEIEDMCSENAIMANDKAKAIKYDGRSSRFPELVSNMKKLRFLYTSNFNFRDDTKVFEAPIVLSNDLRYIHLSGYLASPLPKDFQPTKLVALNLDNSLLKELWRGYKFLPSLKELILNDAHGLVRMPDFSGLPCLQRLTLKSCKKLKEIHASFGFHRSLVYVSIHQCKKLSMFPTIVRMNKLKILELKFCEVLLEFPEIQENMDSLVNLSLINVGIEVLPSSIGKYCTNLITLKLEGCQQLKSIQCNFIALKHLKKFKLTGCTRLEQLPRYLFDEKCSLEELHLPRMRQPLLPLPRFVRTLNLHDCHLTDDQIPFNIGELSNLQELHLSCNDFSQIGFSLSQLTRLKLLNLTRCEELVIMPELPSNISILIADNCYSLDVIGDFVGNCKCLSQVSLRKVSSVTDGDTLLQSMLKGKAIENRSASLQLYGLEIPKAFISPLVQGTRCTLELPKDWHIDFCGFLMCAAVDEDYNSGQYITMKHEGGSMVMDSEPGDWKESCGVLATWVGFVSFGSLRLTSWWDQTSKKVEFSIHFSYADPRNGRHYDTGFGVSLVPRKSGGPIEASTTYSSPELFDNENDYTHNFKITHDTESVLEIVF